MAAKDHGPSINDDEQYEALREEGMSKEKAARIANTPREEAGRRGGEAAPYEEWTKEELEERAAEIGIEGRSSMDKAELIRVSATIDRTFSGPVTAFMAEPHQRHVKPRPHGNQSCPCRGQSSYRIGEDDRGDQVDHRRN